MVDGNVNILGKTCPHLRDPGVQTRLPVARVRFNAASGTLVGRMARSARKSWLAAVSRPAKA